MISYREANKARFVELDGWRGIGCLWVVMFHLENRYIFWMWSWIDMFFILSGFLISRIIIEAYQGGGFSLRNFWVRRILRVWPVYYVVLFLCLIPNVYIYGVHGFIERNGADLLRSLVYLQFTDLYLQPDVTSADFYGYIRGMLHSWSLAVEEQFYVIGPLLMMLLLRWGGVRTLLTVVIALCFVGWAVRAQGVAAYMLLSRMDGLAMGALLALFFLRKQGMEMYFPQRKWIFLAAGVVGALLSAEYIWIGYTQDAWKTAMFGPEQARAVFGMSLVFFGIIGASIEFRGHPLLSPLRHRLLVFPGEISYSLYVVHLPIIVFLRKPLDHYLQSPNLVIAILFFSCVLVGYAANRLIEQPILRFKRYFPVDTRRVSAKP